MIQEEMISWETHVCRNKMGRPIETDELEILLRDPEYKIVQRDRVGPYCISTVWLGVPHGKGDEYFETVIFEANNPEGEKKYFRHRNLVEAEEGHQFIVTKYREKKWNGSK